MSAETRVGVVGAGAVTRLFHAPVLAELERLGEVVVTGVCDPRPEAAHAVAGPRRWPVVADLGTLLALRPDVVLLASPPAVHRAQVEQVVAAGSAVLVEKPAASSAAEALAIVEAARAPGAVVAVGHYRRFLDGFALLGERLRAAPAGVAPRFVIEEGGPFAWPGSDSFFRRTETPGGVLLDMGVHVLDQLVAWLGEPTRWECRHDARPGGLESNAWVSLGWDSGATAEITLSRDWRTRQRWAVELGDERLGLAVGDAGRLRVARPGAAGLVLAADPAPGEAVPAEAQARALTRQWRDVLAARREGRAPRVDAAAGAAAVAWVERLYGSARDAGRSWEPARAPGRRGEAGGRVALVGASGFIGSRVLDQLVDAGVDVVPVVRSVSSLPRVARWPLGWRYADPADADALKSALEGCRAVVHAAIGDPRGIEAQASALGEAAHRAGIGQVVYVSSAMVHGPRPEAGTGERSPGLPGQGLRYPDARVRAEDRLLASLGGVPCVLLRPGVVLGARSRWVSDLVEAWRRGPVGILGDGSGVLDAVGVHDVAGAVLAALARPGVTGAFHLAAPGEPCWRDYYDGLAAGLALPGERVVALEDRLVPPEEASWWRETARPALSARLGFLPDRLKRAAKALLDPGPAGRGGDRFAIEGGRPAPWLPDEWLLLQGARHRVPAGLARGELGWEPGQDLAALLAECVDWHRAVVDGGLARPGGMP